ncbi:CoA transferase subunit A [Arvimicrobium flavum]|uniref:CoA transferase subunit A n=1 Tax=Arvimicrobium flavum TaxID=3393320 RepID=UPI00237C25E4|nr:CoA transferase [Mesorhizobium shangrilense]
MTLFLPLADLVGSIEPGSKLAVPVDYAGVSMAATPHLIARRTGALDLVCVPTGGMQVDMLVGAGLVASVETSAVSLGEAGGAPCFNRAVRQGGVHIVDSTCPAIHAGLLAAQKGVPFIPIRGLIGTDVLAHRGDWKVIDNPFGTDDPIVLVAAIHTDAALFHAPLADRFGNVWIGRRRELAAMAYAARRTLVTVERIADHNLLDDETMAAGVLPALYVDAISEVPRGALPYGLWGEYAADANEIVRYAKAAATEEGFADYVANAGWIREALA